MTTVKFYETIRIRGINPFVPVSAARVARLRHDWRRPMPILVRINGEPSEAWRTNMIPAGDGDFYLYLNGVMRAATETSIGDRIRVEIAFDESYRNGPQHPMPKWFKDALARDPNASANWDALTPSRRKEVLRYFAQLKSPDAQSRNLARAMQVLSGKEGRFMARTWTKGA